MTRYPEDSLFELSSGDADFFDYDANQNDGFDVASLYNAKRWIQILKHTYRNDGFIVVQCIHHM